MESKGKGHGYQRRPPWATSVGLNAPNMAASNSMKELNNRFVEERDATRSPPALVRISHASSAVPPLRQTRLGQIRTLTNTSPTSPDCQCLSLTMSGTVAVVPNGTANGHIDLSSAAAANGHANGGPMHMRFASGMILPPPEVKCTSPSTPPSPCRIQLTADVAYVYVCAV